MNGNELVIVFGVLAAVSFIGAVIGFVLFIRSNGKPPADGAAAQPMRRPANVAPGVHWQARESTFAGKGVYYERDASISGAEIKQDLQHGRVRTVLPVLLTTGGIFGTTFFLSLILLLRMENKIFGGFVLFFSLAWAYQAIKSIVRGEGGDDAQPRNDAGSSGNQVA